MTGFQEEIQKLNFPITPFLDEICTKLRESKTRSLVLTAETGAGKSTVLPLALLNNFSGKILMTEPRRISVLGVANRLSYLLDEPCGKTVGYQIHLEKKISSETKLEVATEAILVRMLQEDPALENINLVVLDEFHERSVQLDMALAFLKEAMELRDDLYVIIMSATIDCERIAAFFDDGENCNRGQTPIMKIPGKTFPVEFVYDDKAEIAQAVVREAGKFIGKSKSQTLLAFLPGISDIRKCVTAVKEKISADSDFENFELYTLHSSVSLDEQRKVLKAAQEGTHRIIISSAIAETSLTIPDVTVVIDSGLSRVNRLNIATGMESLVTEKESEFSAAQRAGRAGRVAAGKCVRLWNEFDLRQKVQEPEILRADLVPLVLECAERGVYNLEKIQWLDKPNSAGWKTSCQLLQTLGCITANGHITEKGKAALRMGVHPRLACILLSGGSPELVIKYTNYANSSPDVKSKFIKDLENRLTNGRQNAKPQKDITDAEYILEGFPDRLAKKVTALNNSKGLDQQIEYQFAIGRKGVLGRQNLNIQQAPDWIIAPEVVIGKQSVIYEFEEISEEKVQKFIQNKTNSVEICKFIDGKISKTQEIRFGEIVISSKKMQSFPEDFAAAWVNEVHQEGLKALPIDDKIENFLVRWQFYEQQLGRTGDLEVLAHNAEQWLPPFISGVTKLTSQIIYDALYWYLEGSKIDGDAPEQIILPTGRRCKLRYEKLASPEDKNVLVIRPVIEIIIQRIFGCFETPKVCGMKVLLRLLSPASRPLQITDDLENFWTGAWPEICKEMKGRYPKHNWDYKVSEPE